MIAADDTAAVGYIGRIPVRNIWLLMLYASELYRELPQDRSVEAEDDPHDLPNLIAEILTRAVERRMRRNLSFDYRRRRADLDRVRGRIDVLRTERRRLLQRGRVACAFDELTIDTPRNRFVKAALHLLNRIVGKPDLAHRCRDAAARMERAGVSGDPSAIRRRPRTLLSRLGRLGEDDREMLAAAHLAFDLALPTEDAGARRLSAPNREEVWARQLFERAVGGFYDVALHPQGWRVRRGRRIRWQIAAKSPGIDAVLPSMQTDVELNPPASGEPRRRIVIDTKFTAILEPGRDGNPRLASGYIYQMYAYLRSQERSNDPASLDSSGVLLHPSVGVDFDEYAVIQGHEMRFATVDLAADSGEIRRHLLRIVDASPP